MQATVTLTYIQMRIELALTLQLGLVCAIHIGFGILFHQISSNSDIMWYHHAKFYPTNLPYLI